MNNNIYEIAFTEFKHLENGHVIVYFKNNITCVCRWKEYKNASIAYRESTKYLNRVSRNV